MPDDETQLRTLARFPRENPNPVFRISGSGTIDYANDAGLPLLETIASGDYRDALARVRRTGEPEAIEVLVDERVFRLDVTPIDGADYLYIYGKDVTGERDAEKKTRAMAKFPLENPNPVMRVGRTGVIEFANEPAHDLLYRLNPQYELRVPESWLLGLETVQHSAEPGEIEIPVDDRWYRLAITPIPNADYLYIYGQDVTERRRAERELMAARDGAEAANRTKNAFLATMSHELRTPLNAILGYCQLLHDEAADAGHEAYLPDLEKIEAASTHLLELISHVLDMSHLEAGEMELECELFDVAPLLESLKVAAASLTPKNGNRFELQCDTELGQMRTDPVRLRQILLHLLDNAFKFTHDGTIRLSARREVREGGDTWLHFEVSDTGIGMSPAQVATAFEPFRQVDESSSREAGGIGLGLAITRSLCETMHGSVSVTSGQGEGTTCVVSLPVEPPCP